FIGAGASGIATAKLLMKAGAKHIIACDRAGALYRGRTDNMNSMKERFAKHTNEKRLRGTVADAHKGADVFIGLSGPGVVSLKDIKAMNRDPIVFAMANPVPEILPEEAGPYVRVMATGRSDYPNQINNSCCFPGFFRGMLDVRAKRVNDEMKLAAAQALAAIVTREELSEEYITPSMFDARVVPAVAGAVAEAAIRTGVAWRKALGWKPPYAKWCVGGKLNVSYNCLDRHVEGPRKTRAALIWEGEPGDSRVLTYWDLYREVNRFAAALKGHGARKGDRITIYMPMVPELPIAMLACARIGAAHSVIFGGFSPEAVRERIHDAESTLVITADGGWRRGSTVPLKKNTDEALRGAPGVKTVVVLKRTGQPVEMQSGRDIWWDDFVKGAPAQCPAEPMDSEDLLYLLYTSGSTGKP